MGLSVLSHPQDKEQLLTYFETHIMHILNWLAAFSPDENGGITRLLYTEGWLNTQQALAVKMASHGLETEFDEVGNLFGKLQGEDRHAPSIITGSHIDTVVQGGKYDGAYGIAAGLLAVNYLQQQFGKPKRTIEVVSLCEEEGSRFPIAYWGSGSIAGKRDFEQIARLRDMDEVSFTDAMRECGFGEGSGRSSRRQDIGAFIEVHIEQGAVLETEKAAIGIVDAIAGQRRMKFEVTGEPNHAGTTPMHMRRDALEGASAMIQELRREAMKQGAPLVATVGQLNVQPNVPNVVPGKVMFTVDARHGDEEALGSFCEWVMNTFKRLAEERDLAFSGMEWFSERPVPMDAGIKRHMDEITEELGIASMRMVSGAGHDAVMFEHICKAGMLFVPSRGGISHSPLEYTAPSELAAGVLVLAELLYRLGYGEER
ncbi:allantoate deiminase [Paenibacillus harenae]|uniref:Allantoate deiminase n=1 Tax=Paenibacillus harenae TaxID=306543 RepID=A0ABT9U8E8_PAEHA|nr:allantoate deiminase [Paenibacillus harenae]MDQ0114719.1 allantoate deiminase [Paenibacillus harenae]